LKDIKSPGIYQIPAELLQAGEASQGLFLGVTPIIAKVLQVVYSLQIFRLNFVWISCRYMRAACPSHYPSL
jgi:hypothetical protein